MDCEIQHVENNIRYRVLNINGERYILDMERSFWKILFPFFYWVFPHSVFKIEDLDIVKQLKTSKREKSSSSRIVLFTGVAYVLGILLTPLMDYFEISTSPLVNVLLLILSLILVVLFYLSISHNRKKNLESVVKLEILPKRVLKIKPKSKNRCSR